MGFILYQSMVKPCAWASEHHGADEAKKSREAAKTKLKDLKDRKTSFSGKIVAGKIRR